MPIQIGRTLTPQMAPTFGYPNMGHPLVQGLLAWYPFGDGGGVNVSQIAPGYTSNGTFAFKPLTFNGSFSWEQGPLGPALVGGSGIFSTIQSGANALSIFGGGPFSISAWVKWNGSGAGTFRLFFGDADGAGNNPALYLGIMNTDVWGSVAGSTSVAPVSNKWTNFVFTFQPSVASTGVGIYIDGIRRFSGTSSTLNNGGGLATFLRDGSFGGLYWLGSICNVALWSRELSAAEIQWLYMEPYAMLAEPSLRKWSSLIGVPSIISSIYVPQRTLRGVGI